MPYRVFIGSGRTYPVYFDGKTRDDAVQAANM
jgi:hypothetical protein